MLDRLGELRDRFIGIPMLNAFPDTVVQMALQNHLANLVQGAFYRVYLYQDILAGNILVDHFVNGLYLSRDFIEPSVKVVRIHALTHLRTLPMIAGGVGPAHL